MNRLDMISRLRSESFDVAIIGGGATGLGIAVDSASRGYRTALLEAHDFAKATSSRSTKLVHGGVRYLEQLDLSLVTEALRERGIMCRNAPHLVSNLAFVIPQYKWWEGPFYGVGMKFYDALAGELNIEKSTRLNRTETIAAIPNVQQEGLLGGIKYHDGQFDDARMAITLATTAAEQGAAIANYIEVTDFVKEDGAVVGLVAKENESQEEFQVRAKVVVNATGIFSDRMRKMDDPDADEKIEPAQGVHLVLDRSFLRGDSAIMVPHTDDGRVLFVIPWHDRVLVGTTDTPMQQAQLEPRPLPEEVEFILRNAGRYLQNNPSTEDVLCAFAGQRPLVHPGGKSGKTKSISRRHEVFVSRTGLVSVTGGKWTIYRKMAEDAMKHVIEVGQLTPQDCCTEQLHLHGYLDPSSLDSIRQDHLRAYGADAEQVKQIGEKEPRLAKTLHPALPYTGAEVAWAVRHEMAICLEDILTRRTRSLLLDAKASCEAAESVAEIMANELSCDNKWVSSQVTAYRELAEGYLLKTI
jgi:glycerol-3-phosphate dehydrogenase